MTCTDIQQEHGRSTDFSRWSSPNPNKTESAIVISSVLRAQVVCPFSSPEPVVLGDIPKTKILVLGPTCVQGFEYTL